MKAFPLPTYCQLGACHQSDSIIARPWNIPPVGPAAGRLDHGGVVCRATEKPNKQTNRSQQKRTWWCNQVGSQGLKQATIMIVKAMENDGLHHYTPSRTWLAR
jgi:hypothetical protein